MWQPCLNVLREQAKNAVMVLDRFHVMVKFNKALDEVRAGKARRLEQDGYEPVLKHSRWSLLKRPENLTDQQTVNLSELLKYNLQSVRGTCCARTFSGSGSIALPPGPKSSWASGAAARCALGSHPTPEVGPHVAQARGPAAELVLRRGGHILWYCGGFQQQSQIKVVGFPHRTRH